MKPVQNVLLVIAIIFVLGMAAAIAAWRSLSVSMFLPTPSAAALYPPAPTMPAVVPDPIEDLLTKYEDILSHKAPAVLASLQPGLTDAAIDSLEAANGFKLPPDMRALYRWRNGTRSGTTSDPFPDHWFSSLDDAILQRAELDRQIKSSSAVQRRFLAAYAGHRTKWLGIMNDPGGDGYFFDPDRAEPEGSFFYCFPEDGSYVFFPSVRNYIAALIEGYASGIFDFGPYGAQTHDFVRAQALWRKYGAERLP